MEVSQMLSSFLLCPTIPDDTSVFQGQLYRGSAIKLILSNSSTFSQNSIHARFLHSILLLESVKLIISERYLTDVPTIFQNQNLLHNHTNLRISPVDGILRFSTKTEVAFVFLDVKNQQNQNEIPFESQLIDTKMIRINSNYKGFQIRGHLKFPFNLSPNNIQFIFIGSSSNVQTVLNLEQIQVLKFKRGVAVTDEHIENLLMERPLPFTRDVTIRKVDLGSKVLHCDVSHQFLRYQHIVIDSYPSKLFRFTDDSGRHIGGMCYKFVETIANYYNFTFDYRIDSYSLKQEANGSWTGWIGDMVDGRADMTIMSGPSVSRYPYCELTNPTFYVHFGLISPIPHAGVRWHAMFLTLEPNVWLGVGLVLLSAGIMFCFTFKLDQRHCKTSSNSIAFDSLIAGFLIFLRKDAKLPLSGRLFTVSFLIFSTFIGLFFDTQLTSSLTLPKLDLMPENLNQLAAASDFKINFIHYVGAVGTVYLQTNQDPAVKTVVARMNYVPVANYSEPLVETVLGEKSIMIDYQELAMMSVAEELTLYPGVYPVKLGKSIVGLHQVINLRKYSKYHEEMNAHAGSMVNTGHFLKWNHDALELASSNGVRRLRRMTDRGNRTEFYEKLLKVTEELMSSSFKPFALDHFVFCFISWASGCALGFLWFFLELLVRVFRIPSKKIKSSEVVSRCEGLLSQLVALPLRFDETRSTSRLEHRKGAERIKSYQIWTCR